MSNSLSSDLFDPAVKRMLRICAEKRQTAVFSRMHGSAQALLARALNRLLDRPILWITDGDRTLDLFARDLISLSPGDESAIMVFPARDLAGTRNEFIQPEITGDRLQTLQALRAGGPPPVIAACVQSVMQYTERPGDGTARHIDLRLGDHQDLQSLTERLDGMGYAFEPQVTAKGEASHRGGILDVWTPQSEWPGRIEFFGDEIDSLRYFDPVAQTSLEKTEALTILPASEDAAEGALLTDYLPPGSVCVWIEPDALRAHAELQETAAREASALDTMLTFRELRQRLIASTGLLNWQVGGIAEAEHRRVPLDIEPMDAVPAPAMDGMDVTPIQRMRADYLRGLNARAAEGCEVAVYLSTPGMRERFEEECRRSGFSARDLHVVTAPLSEGFAVPDRGIYTAAESDIYGGGKTLPGRYETRMRRTGIRQRAGARIQEWTDIQPGDFVVHAEQGIGRYLGVFEIRFNEKLQEVLAIEYARGARLYVPVAQAHLLSRYIGMSRKEPALHRLGGKRWKSETARAHEAVRDLAASLLETQAMRDAMKGRAFSPDTSWQAEFEATFPYRETPDQEQALREVKKDMESTHPMDRLICGDVGYGKTEVAMRAAFKAVMDGRQVAVLVPTTILAQQHYDTFRDRMQAFPVTIDMLSRFRTRGQQQQVIERMKSGGVDIVIGTHRLVQDDIGFKNLGLIIIDEEQRFGVEHKEKLKQLRQLVDVLTLTATPIPRTLYLSLTGAKDMSTIQTPPRERLPIETIVTRHDDHLIREVALREINREGQVFFLHNRVESIGEKYRYLKKLIPEARIATAHGRMHEKELADIMHRFTRGDIDILLCTTIIESGVDIPNVNTIIIDRADRFGMADLYQLRGRVGRHNRKAYAYLLLPRHGHLFDTARKRIHALKKYSSLGAGFRLALRDLEIRGAGNLLGAEQSGHIAAVGFDLYCQLLNRTVAALKSKKPPPIIDADMALDFLRSAPSGEDMDDAAVIPYNYVDDETLRVRLYRELAQTCTEGEVMALRRAWKDRFGPLPVAAENLLLARRVRIAASTRGLARVEVKAGKIMLQKGKDDYVMSGGRFPRLTETAANKKLRELLKTVKS